MRKRIIKIWAKINEIENKAIGKKHSETKKIFLKKNRSNWKTTSNTETKSKWREDSNFQNQEWDGTSIVKPVDTKMMTRGWITTHNLDESNQNLEKHALPQFTQYELDHLNSTITLKEIEFTIKNSQKRSLQAQMFREEIAQFCTISSKTQKRSDYFPIHFMKLIFTSK